MAQLPQEFLTRMQEMLGDEFDAFLTSYDAPRTAGLRVNTKKCRTEDFPPLVPGTWKKIPWIPNGYFVPDGMRMGQSPLYAAGVFYLQEPSAMTPASRLPIEPGERVLDLCAAPGGKTFTMAELMNDSGKIISCDIHPHRVELIKNGAKRLTLTNIQCVVNDASIYNNKIGTVDKVLCDVPCSGFGIIRRKPEIRYKELDSVKDLPDIQYNILSVSSKYLKKDGLIVYSTCTLNKKENEKVVKRFLDNNDNFKLIKEKTAFPSENSGDGFYYAVMTRNND